MHAAYFGTNTISSSGPNLWKLISHKTKHASIFSASKPRINLGPSATAHVDYAKYLWKILALLKFVRVSNWIRTNPYSFFLKKGKRVSKLNLEHLDLRTELHFSCVCLMVSYGKKSLFQYVYFSLGYCVFTSFSIKFAIFCMFLVWIVRCAAT